MKAFYVMDADPDGKETWQQLCICLDDKQAEMVAAILNLLDVTYRICNWR